MRRRRSRGRSRAAGRGGAPTSATRTRARISTSSLGIAPAPQRRQLDDFGRDAGGASRLAANRAPNYEGHRAGGRRRPLRNDEPVGGRGRSALATVSSTNHLAEAPPRSRSRRCPSTRWASAPTRLTGARHVGVVHGRARRGVETATAQKGTLWTWLDSENTQEVDERLDRQARTFLITIRLALRKNNSGVGDRRATAHRPLHRPTPAPFAAAPFAPFAAPLAGFRMSSPAPSSTCPSSTSIALRLAAAAYAAPTAAAAAAPTRGPRPAAPPRRRAPHHAVGSGSRNSDAPFEPPPVAPFAAATSSPTSPKSMTALPQSTTSCMLAAVSAAAAAACAAAFDAPRIERSSRVARPTSYFRVRRRVAATVVRVAARRRRRRRRRPSPPRARFAERRRAARCASVARAAGRFCGGGGPAAARPTRAAGRGRSRCASGASSPPRSSRATRRDGRPSAACAPPPPFLCDARMPAIAAVAVVGVGPLRADRRRDLLAALDRGRHPRAERNVPFAAAHSVLITRDSFARDSAAPSCSPAARYSGSSHRCFSDAGIRARLVGEERLPPARAARRRRVAPPCARGLPARATAARGRGGDASAAARRISRCARRSRRSRFSASFASAAAMRRARACSCGSRRRSSSSFRRAPPPPAPAAPCSPKRAPARASEDPAPASPRCARAPRFGHLPLIGRRDRGAALRRVRVPRQALPPRFAPRWWSMVRPRAS